MLEPTRREVRAPAPPPRPGERLVLLVEDEPALRRIMARTLEVEGYTVLEAANGREALELLHRLRYPIDLLVADIRWSGSGGAGS